MTSDDKSKDFGADDNETEARGIEDAVSGVGADDDIVDVVDADDADMDGDEDYSFDITNEKKQGGGMKKIIAPVLVLTAAAGIGGFIVMNPDIIGKFMGSSSAPAMEQQAASSAPTAFGGADATAMAPELPQPAGASGELPAPAPATEMAAMEAPVMDAPIMDATAPAPETPVAVAAEEQMPRAPDGVMDVTAGESPVAVPAQDVAMNGGPDAWQAPAPEAPAPEAQAPTPPVEQPTPEITPAQLNDAAPAAPGDAPVMPVEMGSADPAPVVQTATPAEATPPAMPVQAPPVEVPPAAAAPMPTPEAMPQQGTMAQVSPPAAKSTGDAYYDAGINLPRGPIAKETIREADPSIEPGQKMIIAKKDYNQSSQEALLESASRALKLQRYDAALEMYEQLYAKNKRDRRILMGLAVAQQYSGRTESAIQTYESLLDIDPKNADAMVNMLGLLKAQYPEVALRRLMDMQKRFPGNAGIAAQIGITQAELGHHDDAVRYLQMAASLEPRNAQHLYNIAVIADRKGAKADAMKYYEQALEADAIYSGGKSLQREAIYDRLAKLRTN